MSGILQALLASFRTEPPPPIFLLTSFGANDRGQIGDNTVQKRSSPVLVGGYTPSWSNADAGLQVSIGVKEAGSLWAWGDNLVGTLGQGTASTATSRSSPTQVGALTTWSSGHTAYQTMFALKADSTLWGWGRNTIGDGTSNFRSSPVQIGGAEWAKVNTGQGHTLAIKTAGSLWSWGYRTYYATGQGIGSGTQLTPAQIGVLTTWAEVTAGKQSSLAIKTDGTLWAWGNNDFGQLGLNSTTATAVVTQVGGLSTWAKVSSGAGNSGGHTLAVKTDGTLWAWGNSLDGRIDNNYNQSFQRQSSPVQVTGTTWGLAAAGQNHSIALRE